MSVKVTREDIRHGVPDSPASCPVALAIARAQGGGVATLYHSDILSTRGVFDTPERVAVWMSDFDYGNPVRPFTFTLKKRLESYPMPDRWPRWLYWE